MSRSSPGRLQDSHPIYWLADQYCLQITVPISVTYYPIISPPSSCIYRASRATFTINSFIQFFHTAKLIVMGPDRTTCWPINWIALPVAPSIYYLIQEVTTSTTFANVLSFFIYQTNGRPTLVDERIQPTNQIKSSERQNKGFAKPPIGPCLGLQLGVVRTSNLTSDHVRL